MLETDFWRSRAWSFRLAFGVYPFLLSWHSVLFSGGFGRLVFSLNVFRLSSRDLACGHVSWHRLRAFFGEDWRLPAVALWMSGSLGFWGGFRCTLLEVAKGSGVTRERIERFGASWFVLT
jgi:hypothetical protein